MHTYENLGDAIAECSNACEVELQEQVDHRMDISDVPVAVDNASEHENLLDNVSTSDYNESDSRNDVVAGSDNTNPHDRTCVDGDIVLAVLKAFSLADEMGASQKNLMDIVNYGRDLYCQGDMERINRWPKNYSACLQVLRNAGYRDPVTYHVCLSETHPNLWCSLQHPMAQCQYCGQQASITYYYYLQLSDKVKRWCSSIEFCFKMTAHWRDHATWINSAGLSDSSNQCLNEIWHGSR